MYENDDFENMSIESLKIIIDNLKNKPKHTQVALKNYLNKLKKDNENKKYIEIMGKNKIMCPIEDCFSTLTNEGSLKRHIGEYSWRIKGLYEVKLPKLQALWVGQGWILPLVKWI